MRLKHLTRAAVITGAVAAPLALALPAAQAAPSPSSSAFGLSATGPVNIAPTPAVAYNGHNTVSKNTAAVPSNPVLSAKVLHASAGKGHAKASVVNLKVPRANLTASLVAAKCVNGKATSHLANVVLNGKKLNAAAKPNSGVSVQLDGVGTASVVLNKQTPVAGGGVNVTAIELTLPLGAGKTETIKIASATCGADDGGSTPGDPGTSPSPQPTPSTPPSATPPPSQAPAPTPVPGDLPVTG